MRVGTYSTPVTCGVVPGMSVPLLLGTDYTDVHVPKIFGPKGYVQLLNGCKSIPSNVGCEPLSRIIRLTWHICQLWAEVWENRSSHQRREPDLRTELLVGQI